MICDLVWWTCYRVVYTCMWRVQNLLIVGALSPLSGESWKSLWFLLLLVVVVAVIAANNSGM